MEYLSTKAILLDMTTDLSRVGIFTLQKKEKRVLQFANKLEEAVSILEKRVVPKNIDFFVKKVSELLASLKQEKIQSVELLADDAFTYGNILSRRASRLVS
jgi:hypothetical protein